MNLNSEFHIFRDSRRRAAADELVAQLGAGLSQLSSCARLERVLNVLLLAGELECGLADAGGLFEDVAAASRLTSMLAEAAVRSDTSGQSPDGRALSGEGLALLQQIHHRGPVTVAVPEGFAHYALHPLDYADLIGRLRFEKRRAFIVGVRSIGTTLSAVVWAKLRQLGIEAERTSVRPAGHPYDRRCEFGAAQQQAIVQALRSDTEFLVCDEGPGRSGSSLLSVAEALEREGVAQGRILILCSHQPDVNALCASDATRRWQRYRSAATGMTRRLPSEAREYAGGSEWRRYFMVPGEPWPAVWPQMERLRYLSADRKELFTFAGHGPYGTAARTRNEALSASGFGAPYPGHESGFGRHLLPSGRLARQSDLAPGMLAHVAEYCAWRAREFSVADVDSGDLESVTRTNFAREFGAELDDLELPVTYPTVCDNRIAPHHWLVTDDGRVLKLDAAIHGDDHFFPGPCDIAWDLTGVIVEWSLDASAREFFLQEYHQASGDDASSRIEGYILAYAMFRLAWSKMAAASIAGNEEEVRLMRDYRRYRKIVQDSARGATESQVSPAPRLIFSAY